MHSAEGLASEPCAQALTCHPGSNGARRRTLWTPVLRSPQGSAAALDKVLGGGRRRAGQDHDGKVTMPGINGKMRAPLRCNLRCTQ